MLVSGWHLFSMWKQRRRHHSLFTDANLLVVHKACHLYNPQSLFPPLLQCRQHKVMKGVRPLASITHLVIDTESPKGESFRAAATLGDATDEPYIFICV
jgi:hypothetical protein